MDEQYAAPVSSFLLERDTSPDGSTWSTCRVGTLALSSRDDARATVQTLETPALVSNAPRGAIAHLTPDNSTRCRTKAVHLSLEHFLDVQPPPFASAPFALDHFIGLSPSQTQRYHAAAESRDSGGRGRVLISMGLRAPPSRDRFRARARTNDNCQTAPQNRDDVAVALGGRGVVKVSPREYLNWTLPRPPDLLLAMVDEPDEGEMSQKRVEKSVRRSLVWLDEIARGAQDRVNVFATLVGGQDSSRRTEFARALLGISSSRASVGVSPASPIDALLAGYVVTCTSPRPFLTASLSPLPRTKPRIAVSPRGPHEILRLVAEVGIDLFVEEWSQTCATVGVALDFNFPVPRGSSSRPVTNSSSLSSVPPPPSLQRPTSASTDSVSTTTLSEIGINLYLSEHKYSFTPLSTSNLAPQPPPSSSSSSSSSSTRSNSNSSSTTRSYVHHLLVAHELTSHVLLAVHNHAVMQRFLESVRTVLERQGPEAFLSEVELFERTYRDREPTPPTTTTTTTTKGEEEYRVVEEARKSWETVERERGKGSERDKAFEMGPTVS